MTDRYPPSQCEPVDRGASPIAGFALGILIGLIVTGVAGLVWFCYGLVTR